MEKNFHFIDIEGYRKGAVFRIWGNVGCVVTWKPTAFCFGVERLSRGVGFFLGFGMVAVGSIYPDKGLGYVPDAVKFRVQGRSEAEVPAQCAIKLLDWEFDGDGVYVAKTILGEYRTFYDCGWHADLNHGCDWETDGNEAGSMDSDRERVMDLCQKHFEETLIVTSFETI